MFLAPGGSFVLEWRNTDEQGNRATMHATITALDPPRLLELTGDLHGVLRFALRPTGEATTHLSFTSTLALPDEFRTKVLAGWHFHLDSLARSLDGQAVDLARLPGWQEIHEHYVAGVPTGAARLSAQPGDHDSRPDALPHPPINPSAPGA